MSEEARPAVRLALVVEYDGTHYKGFQYQSEMPTIQGSLENAIFKTSGEEVRVRGASRTDAGVHAKGQVVDFMTYSYLSERTWTQALNFHLPWDIKIRSTYRTSSCFHSRRSALGRTYKYTILNRDTPSPLLHNQSAWIRTHLDVKAMSEGAQSLIGIHDFSAFTRPLPDNKSGIRHVKKWEVWREGHLILIETEANAYMLHQILRTNGILVEIGRKMAPISAIHDMINSCIIERRTYNSLPAKGLCLVRVQYPDFKLRKEKLRYETA